MDRREQQLFYLLQLSGGTFPSGGFSQSWGLETYVNQGRMQTEEDFISFIKTYLDVTITGSEGPAACAAYDASVDWCEEKLLEIDERMTAMKLTKESREAGLRMGKAFLRIGAAMLKEKKISDFYEAHKGQGINYTTGFGMVCGRLGIEKERMIESYVFSSINAIVQSAVKLIPLGNIQAQKLLCSVYDEMYKAARESLTVESENWINFCPGFDIASILHETLPVRLYMS